MTGATAGIAAFIVRMQEAAPPEEARTRAARVIADSFACILSGAGSEVARPMLAYLDRAPAGPAPVLGTARHVSPDVAALANGAFGAALDYDDLLSPTHPSAVVVATLASVADGSVSGLRFIDAYLVGIEVGAKIAAALGRGHSARGFHATATLTGFSAFAALAHLERLPAEAIERGIGLVATSSGGLLCNLGTMAKPLHSGLAAQRAIVARDLALLGVTVSPTSLEVRNGFFQAYGDEESDAGRIAASLGSPWSVLEPGSTLKRFPSCIAGHRAIAAVRDLKRQGLEPENLVALDVSVAPGALQPLMYPRPETGLEAKFSMPYAMAAALVDNSLAIATFETPSTGRADLAAVMDRITAWEDPAQVEEDPVAANLSWGFRGYARVTATLTDGRTLQSRVDVPPGHPSTPLDWDDLREKFLDCAGSAGLPAPRADEALSALRNLAKQPDILAILDLMQLTPATRKHAHAD